MPKIYTLYTTYYIIIFLLLQNVKNTGYARK